jgi:hypothetical protein
MHRVAHRGCHDCAPRAWRHVPNLTGDYDLDATILHRKNPDMAHRLSQHISAPRGMAYRPRVAKGANHGNHGDD